VTPPPPQQVFAHSAGEGTAHRANTPWGPVDAVRIATLNVVGLALVLSGWVLASGQLLFKHQVTGANVAIAGIVFAGVGDGLWLLSGRRALGVRKRTLTSAIEHTPWKPRAVEATQPTLVAAKGMTRYHRPDCAFVAGRRVYSRKRETHENQGRQPCAVCKP
jgi:hypothetical protein